MTPAVKRKAIKAATLYLDMRGFEIYEANWGQGRYKIDIVASYKSKIYFIEVLYYKDLASSDQINLLTKEYTAKLKAAAEAWRDEAKYQGNYVFSRLELSGQDYSVIGFSDNYI
jgi:Holliday junction resolvase-like predicted endonuclease